MLKHFILLIGVIGCVMWVSASIAGASMRLTGTLMAFCGAGMIALFIWVYLEIGQRAITATLRGSKIMQSLVSLATSDWVRAMLLIGLNVLIPASFLLCILNQKARQIRKITTSKRLFTDGAYKVIDALLYWRWHSIFTKANLLVMLYWTLSVGVAKATVVFLSWMNAQLAQMDFVVVLVIFFIMGWSMFLAPPVPGIPVYICSGIVIAARAREPDMKDQVGYAGGIVIAIFLSLILKLAAVAGQYAIGYFLGKSVKVQKEVGVDKVFIRGVEKILQTRGLNPAKVAILIGGPDWPTSVLCGILKLNLFQCLLGTCPVILISSPCVLAGAFLAGPNSPDPTGAEDESQGLWDTLSSTALGASALGQMASGILAMYYTQDVIYKYSDELAKPRPEHEPVALLTQAEADMAQAYMEVTDWKALSKAKKILVLASVTAMLFSLFCFMFLDEMCFRPFAVSSSIDASYGQAGLDGKPLSIVMMPGWAAHAIFVLACTLHIISVKIAGRNAKALLAAKKASGQLGGGNKAENIT